MLFQIKLQNSTQHLQKKVSHQHNNNNNRQIQRIDNNNNKIIISNKDRIMLKNKLRKNTRNF